MRVQPYMRSMQHLLLAGKLEITAPLTTIRNGIVRRSFQTVLSMSSIKLNILPSEYTVGD